MKRVLSLVLALVLVLGMMPTFAADATGAEQLYAYGFISGDNGDLMVDKTLTRAEMAVVLSELFGVKEEAANFALPSTFSDVSVDSWYAPYVAYGQASSWFSGYPDGTYDPAGTVNQQELAAFLLNALGYSYDWATAVDTAATIGIDVAAGDALLRGAAFEAVWAAVNTAKEGSDVALGVELGKLPAAAVTGMSVEATGAKKLTVTFGAAVDTAATTLTVAKGAVAVSTDKVEFAADAKSAVITLTTNLTKGDYTVTATGAATEALTATVTAADEKVAAINLKSDKAAINSGNTAQAYVRYEVLNQYGEKMSAATYATLTWTISTGLAPAANDTTNGILTIANGSAFVPTNTVYVTAVHAASATVLNSSVTITTASQTDKVVFKGVYDTTKSEMASLPAGFAAGRYVMLYEVYDQYGFKIASPTFAELVFTSNAPLFVASTFPAGAPATQVVDSVTYQAVALTPGTQVSKGGAVTIQAISTITGAVSTVDLAADALSAVASFSLEAPTTIVAEGDTVTVPYSAVDQYGNAVTSYSKLTTGTPITLSPAWNGTDGLRFEQQADGSAKLKYYAPVSSLGATATVDVPVYMTSVVTAGGNFSSIMVNVKDTAVPTAITGFDPTSTAVSTYIARQGSVSIGYSDLVVIDQYGRVMTDAKVLAWLDTAAANSIVVTETTGNAMAVTPSNGANVIGATVSFMAVSGETVTVAAGNNTTASEVITFALDATNAGTTPVAASTKSFTFTNVQKSAYTSYEVKAIGTMYNEGTAAATTAVAYNKTLTVYGVMANGTKVKLPTTDYVVTVDTTKLTVAANVISDTPAAGFVPADFLDSSNAYKNATANVLVTVNDNTTGAAISIIETELVISNKTPVATTITLESDNVTDGIATVNANVPGAGQITAATLVGTTFIESVKDQYGVADGTAVAVTITNLTKGDTSTFTVTGNATSAVAVTGAKMGDKFTATYKVGNATAVVNFTVGFDS